MRFQNIGKFCPAFQRSRVFFVREKLDAFLLEERRFWWKTSGRFVLARQFLGFHLARFDIRLVEGVDAEDGACDGRGDFPAEEFLPEIVSILESDAHDGVPSLFERGNRGILRLVWLRRQPQISEDPIVAISSWLGWALAINWNN